MKKNSPSLRIKRPLACDPTDREALAFAEELKIVFEDFRLEGQGGRSSFFGKTVKMW